MEPKRIVARFDGVCKECRDKILAGEECYYVRVPGERAGKVTCLRCAEGEHGPEKKA